MRFLLGSLVCCLATSSLPQAAALPSDGLLAERRAALEQSLARLDGEEGRITARIKARTRPVRERELELARLEAELAQEGLGGDLEEVAIATLKAQWEVLRDGVVAELKTAEATTGTTPGDEVVATLKGRLAALDALLASDEPAQEIVALQHRLERRRAALAALRARLLDERYRSEQRVAARARLDAEAKGAAQRIAALEADKREMEDRRTALEEEIQKTATGNGDAAQVELLRAQADLADLEGYRLAEAIATARAHYTAVRFSIDLKRRRTATDPSAAPPRAITRQLSEERRRAATLERQIADLKRRRDLYERRRQALERQAELLTALKEEGANAGRVSVEQRQATVDKTLALVEEHARLLAKSRAAEAAFIQRLEAALTGRADVRLGYRTPRAWSVAALPAILAKLSAIPGHLPPVAPPPSGRLIAAIGSTFAGLLLAGGAHRLRLRTRRVRARLRERTVGYSGVRSMVALVGLFIGLAPPTCAAAGLGVALRLTLPGPVGLALLYLVGAAWASAATRICFRYLRWVLRGGRIFAITVGRRRGWRWLARLGDLAWLYMAVCFGLGVLGAPPASIALLNDGAALTALVVLPLIWWRRPPVFRTSGLARLCFSLLLPVTAILLLMTLAGYHNLALAITVWTAITAGLILAWAVGTVVAADLWRLAVPPEGRLARLASLKGEEATNLARTLTHATSLLLALCLIVWKDPTQALFASPLWRLLVAAIRHPLLHVGGVEVTPLSLMQGALIFAAFIFASRLLRRLLRDRVYPRTRIDAGVRNAINNLINYSLLTIGVLVALQAVGLQLTTLTVFAGALGVGIGFGLQNIANNFVSGLILLLERPVKTGDYIDLGTTRGVVQQIGARSTQIRTRDNIAIVVPNSELISQSVTNWSLQDPKTRIHVGVGVAYGTDPHRVEELLLGVAKAHPQVLTAPPPSVWFQDFGDSSLDFVLLCWVHNPATTGLRGLRSQLRFAIADALAEANIEIPFPQRDLHIRSWQPPPEPDPPDGDTAPAVG